MMQKAFMHKHLSQSHKAARYSLLGHTICTAINKKCF